MDSALPIDLERASRLGSRATSSWSGNEESAAGRTPHLQFAEVQLHKFGGSIVNSVTIHRLPGDEGLADEDVVVVRYDMIHDTLEIAILILDKAIMTGPSLYTH